VHGQLDLGHVYGYRLEPIEEGTLVTSYYDWLAAGRDWKAAAIFPVIPENALRATLGILAPRSSCMSERRFKPSTLRVSCAQIVQVGVTAGNRAGRQDRRQNGGSACVLPASCITECNAANRRGPLPTADLLRRGCSGGRRAPGQQKGLLSLGSPDSGGAAG
jgi:hypothetical protein